MTRRVAIVTYAYPPMNVPGALRAAALARHLPAYGWEPLVVTVTPGSALYLDPPGDCPPPREKFPNGVGDSPPPLQILRTRDLSLHGLAARMASRKDGHAGRDRLERLKGHNVQANGRLPLRALHWVYRHWAAFPDETWPWMLEYPRIRRALRTAAIDAIVSTSPPPTCHLIASRLARDLRVPWIADYRDLWSDRTAWRRTRPLRPLERAIERCVMKRAAGIVTISQPLAEDLVALLGRPVAVIPNGFEPLDAPDTASPLPIDPHRFTLVHTGTLTHGTRDPGLLFGAIATLLDTGDVAAPELDVWLIGRHLEVARAALARWPQLAPLVHLVPSVPRPVALDAQRRASVLVALGTPNPAHAGDVTSKVFEYLQAQRPVLAFAPRDGSLDRLLADTAGGQVVTSSAEAASALLHWLRQWREQGRPSWTGRPERIARYDRRVLTGEFARLLDRVAGVPAVRTEEACVSGP
ncbi:MAG TPA: glycosyltransferase [Vicinamibacterales bacterium]